MLRRQNRVNEWVGVVVKIGDDQVVGSRVDEQMIGDYQMMMN